jgi:hypothetical protein
MMGLRAGGRLDAAPSPAPQSGAPGSASDGPRLPPTAASGPVCGASVGS